MSTAGHVIAIWILVNMAIFAFLLARHGGTP